MHVYELTRYRQWYMNRCFATGETCVCAIGRTGIESCLKLIFSLLLLSPLRYETAIK